MNKILITGGTGLLGRVIVDKLLQLDKRVSVLSSRSDVTVPSGVEVCKGNLTNINELSQAVKDVGTIIHCASNPRNFQEVDVMGTKNLLNVINKDEAPHVIYISIVGIHKSEYAYYKAKLEVEKMIADSGIPFTILRTTQFHNFVYNMIEAAVKDAGAILHVPSGMRFQSVDIQEVSGKLISLCDKAPAGLLEDFGGPQIMTFEEMTLTYLDVSKTRIKLETEETPGLRYDLFRSGVNLCPENAIGKISWVDFLENCINIKRSGIE